MPSDYVLVPDSWMFRSKQPVGKSISEGVLPMHLRISGLSLTCLLTLAFAIVGCNNTLNPLCGSARPAPLIQSLSPASMTFEDVQHGATLTVNGSQFVSSTEAVINSKSLAATVVSPLKF